MPEIVLEKNLVANALYHRHRKRIDALAENYPDRRSMLLPILWFIQEEEGWISGESMAETAEICECTLAQVMEVVSFYVMYNRQPVGKYVLGICATLPCALCGSDGLYDYLNEKLEIGWDETAGDGLFTIQRRECLGACSEAPVMLVNRVLESKLTRASVDQILEECRSGARKPYFSGRNGSS
jgi:NADH-quinone oxidoreductase subunit E